MASGGFNGWPNSGLRVAQSGLTVGVLSPKRALTDCSVAGPWLLALQVVRVARQDCCSCWANVACGAIGDKIQEPSSGQPKSLLETKTAFFRAF